VANDKKNPFGGGNASSLYVPLTEIEQEVIARLVEAEDLEVHILDWGIVKQPRITFGDARMSILWQMNFNRPPTPIDVYYFDLELRTRTGLLLSKSRQVTVYDDKPISVAAGMVTTMVWDIMIHHIDPKVVKALLPHALGLTSRLQDKDTGDVTHTGNMTLTADQRRLLDVVRQGEAKVRAFSADEATKAVKAAARRRKK